MSELLEEQTELTEEKFFLVLQGLMDTQVGKKYMKLLDLSPDAKVSQLHENLAQSLPVPMGLHACIAYERLPVLLMYQQGGGKVHSYVLVDGVLTLAHELLGFQGLEYLPRYCSNQYSFKLPKL